MNNSTRKLRITEDRPIRVDSRGLVFGAEDEGGWLEVWVPPELWEALRSEAPPPCDTDDQRDYALSVIELRAARQEPHLTAGVRVVVLA
jgi:hypothetical protein